MAQSSNQKPGLNHFGSAFSIFPPYRRYRFFEQVERYPFNPKASGHDPVNAWWLAELSALVYDDEHYARKVLTEALDISGSDITWLKHRGIEGLMLDYKGCTIIVFQGTEFPRPANTNVYTAIRTWNNVKTSLSFGQSGELVDDDGVVEHIKVHSGFQQALASNDNDDDPSIWQQVTNKITPTSRLWIAGHSLGGALATITALRLHKQVDGLYTYGCPCVGDQSLLDFFTENLTNKAFGYVNDKDLVVNALTTPGLHAHMSRYKHATEQHAIKVKGDVGWFGLVAMFADQVGLNLMDHCPVYYMLGARWAMPAVGE